MTKWYIIKWELHEKDNNHVLVNNDTLVGLKNEFDIDRKLLKAKVASLSDVKRYKKVDLDWLELHRNYIV